ncbi:unnamed protein product [Linum trigynum]|uniref:Argonaute 5 n=1 Tax=Linum trigynum TaxID=586398 RepID=A0AAV2G0G7_9ROSI
MSRRGGGRRPDSGRDQQPPSPAQSGGGGRGRGGRGRGRGGGDRDAIPPPAQVFGSIGAQAPSPASGFPALGNPSSSRPAPPPASAQPSARPQGVTAAPPPPTAASSSSSSSVQQLAAEVQGKLVVSESTASRAAAPVSSKAIALPRRPGYGTVGRKCMVRANHFLVKIQDTDLRHYDVTITPEVTSKKVNRDVISTLDKLYRQSHLGNKMVAYDGRKSLFTAGALPFESREFEVKLESDNQAGSSAAPRRERVFKVAIKFASRPDIDHLRRFLDGRQRDIPQETIQVLDVVLRHNPSAHYTVVGRSFCSTSLGPKGTLGDGVEYWRGYYQSLRPTQMGLSLNIDVSARSFYEPVPVMDFISKNFRIQNPSKPLSEQDCIKLKKAMRGVKVQMNNGEFTKTYKITGISSKPASHTMFLLDEQNTTISVAQYFQQKYKIRLQYPSLPALQAGHAPKLFYLPIELCKIVEGQRYTKKLNERQVTALLRATCQRPHERERNIAKVVAEKSFKDSEIVQQFGIQVKPQPELIEARVLNPPMLKYHGSGREASVSPQMGQWNMINKKMVNGGTVDYWTCLNFSSFNNDFPIDFCGQLIDMCISKGMVFNKNPLVPIRSERPQHIEKALSDVHYQATQQGKELQLLIIILPDYSGSYGTIKRICETELGIVTQCCQPKQASKFSKQYMENVSLKINVKVGGRNTVLNDAIQRRIPLLTDRPTIVFGADVTHAQPGEDSTPSIAAVVASMDWPEVTKYRGLVSAQTSREEIILDLYKTYEDPTRGVVHGGMIRELLIAFRRSTGVKPDRILFYRDGVSEGQFSQVLLHEVDAIRKACMSLEQGYLPRITFVVVQKRHHTRFFPEDHQNRSMTDRSGNILPGTVVDTKICHPTEFDFYLNSHAGIQGTSKPSHYHVLFDENGFTADGLQVLTNNLCYTYARCTRSVSVVPPAYYAHLTAFRARYYIEGNASDGSSSGERSAPGMPREVQPLPKIKDNVKNVMFYC